MDGAAFDRVLQRLHLAAGRRSVLTSLAGAGLAASAGSAVDTVTAKAHPECADRPEYNAILVEMHDPVVGLIADVDAAI